MGKWRMLCSLQRDHASAALASGPSVITSRVMESLTLNIQTLLFSAAAWLPLYLRFNGAYHPVGIGAVVGSKPLKEAAGRIGYESLAGATTRRPGAGVEARRGGGAIAWAGRGRDRGRGGCAQLLRHPVV